MKLIVGLGNPGEQYKFTRHNVGFLAIDKICEKLGVTLNKSKFNGQYVKIDDLVLAKPMTYMNKSGEFISSLANYFKISTDDILVIHDEKDFPLGKSAIKIGGSGGSHNGVLNIVQQLGTTSFKRLKVGIDSPHEGPLKDFVLGRFKPQEMLVLENVLEKCSEAAIAFSFNDILSVMNKFNSKLK
ncbi:aminoacyl-tRNA hydrolase [Mycoplasmopsis gallopavonis]|uniref:Peptidyl-tRNA hydrolase n=1 Tax=Mycoplasmopsis gallopavonis TaxID=76629 RepID=A0A449AZR1_9BACT|nr:aminoacyl-tRNA hydrolase [Mycoplasmopsis gallopavonis]RIV16299.1 aminoacyl-tRNA hydrolase [Mycoplasmopsis gallopavonis]VEU72631.1 Peptidyl-tRNA hydrolase [Mycoplasmopsis gallopavonis]VEU72974.1 Peptidyl-tRNA hydrolase [Mycoplasmopsis gallopavonis]